MHSYLDSGMTYAYGLEVAGVRIRILAPRAMRFPDSFLPFLQDADMWEHPDWEVYVHFGVKETFLSGEDRVKRFPRRDGADIFRVLPADRKHTCRFFIPEERADSFCQNANWMLLMPWADMFLSHGRFVLHASGVADRGEAILFTAPSGGGKSTQASLWEQNGGSEILNGDKMVIFAETDQPVAYGSPIAGSSGIYKDASAPIKAIVYLHKAPENRVERMDKSRACLALYSQAVKLEGDADFNQALLPLLERIVQAVPVLELSCTPEPEAVDCVRSWLIDFQNHEKEE
jgi:hypothetical protein